MKLEHLLAPRWRANVLKLLLLAVPLLLPLGIYAKRFAHIDDSELQLSYVFFNLSRTIV